MRVMRKGTCALYSWKQHAGRACRAVHMGLVWHCVCLYLVCACVSSGPCLWPPDQARKPFFISEIISQ